MRCITWCLAFAIVCVVSVVTIVAVDAVVVDGRVHAALAVYGQLVTCLVIWHVCFHDWSEHDYVISTRARI